MNKKIANEIIRDDLLSKDVEDESNFLYSFPSPENQITNLRNPNWKEENLTNKYVKIYYEIIDKLKNETDFKHVVMPFNKLRIKKYAKNFLEFKTKVWYFQRHHIDEIKISGAIFRTLEDYKYGEAILVSIEEHFFLHYLIVLAQTTYPNNGMLVQLSWSEDTNIINNKKEYWAKIAKKYCLKYGLEYDSSFLDKITDLSKILDQIFMKIKDFVI
ncbi:hypothetical protein [[Mycoplasma] phocae]|uniref:hypothetical protein n=1 Tax=[Mycoplasma] phocae TaxID=142651 RepID=UPI001B8676D9|nr:hypothetical protein [[Mycoplasma] phocae]